MLVVGGLAILVLWLAWTSRRWPLVHDAPIMHYIAWRILEGAAPYRDLFDMNFPGTYALHLGVVGLLGTGDAAWRAFDLAWLAAGSLAVAALAAPWGGVASAGGALFFAAHHLAGGAGQAGQRDFLLCPFLLLGALGVARWLEAPAAAPAGGAPGAGAPRWRALVGAGLALGAAITIKPHTAVLAAALGAFVVAGGRGPRRAAPAALYAAAVLAPPAASVAWVGALGALPAWRAIVLEYLVPLYARLGRPPSWGFHRWQAWIPVAVALGVTIGATVRRRRLTSRHAVVLAGLGYGIAHYVGQGKGWEYHVYPAAAFASALLFAELGRLLRARRPLAGAALAASLVAAVVMLGAKGAEAADAAWIADKERRVAAIVAALRGRLAPGDLVQVLDTTGGGVHALLRLGVAQPTRFVYDFHFFHDTSAPVIQALRAELVRGLDARPPRCIVVLDEGWPAGGQERIAAFPELADRLGRGFRPAARGDGWVIHAQRDDP